MKTFQTRLNKIIIKFILHDKYYLKQDIINILLLHFTS